MNTNIKLLTTNLPIILASKSPRRKKLLEQLGIEFEIIPSMFDEDSIEFDLPEKYCVSLALNKAIDVANKIDKNAIVVGCDTIVVLDNAILNKPINQNDAFEMLKKLSGKTHTVYTGLAFVNSNSKYNKTVFKTTEVTFRNLEDDEIWAYIKTGSPMDKAGAYGIQDDFGAVFVSHINGCYYNIVGLPLELFYSTLKEFERNEF